MDFMTQSCVSPIKGKLNPLVPATMAMLFSLFKHINLLPTSGCICCSNSCKAIISWWSLFISVVSVLLSQEFLHNKGHFLPSFPSPVPFFFSPLLPSSRPSTACFDLNNFWNCLVTFKVHLSRLKAEPASKYSKTQIFRSSFLQAALI